MNGASQHPPDDTAHSGTPLADPVSPAQVDGAEAGSEAGAQAADVARLRSAALDSSVEMALAFDPTWSA